MDVMKLKRMTTYDWETVEHHPTEPVEVEVAAGTRDDIRIIKVHGPLTINNFFEFQDLARKQPSPRLLVIDLEDVPYIDSAALGSFIGIHVSCDKAGRKCALTNVNDRIKSLFVMSGVDQFLVTRETVADAEANLSK
jgi:anti-anti-sigma factor